MKYFAQFECINPECKSLYPLTEVIYKCRHCGEILQVSHNMEALKQKSADEWKSLFDSRRGSFEFPNDSGIWSKREWVLPEIEPENIVSSGEGWTHLFNAERWAKKLGLESLYVKQCGVSHTGSFKDLGMTVLVSQVNQLRKQGKNIRAVACASTGDTSAALASYAAKAGVPTIVFLPADKVSTAQLIQPVSNGAKVISMDTDFDGCMKIVQEVSEDSSIYLANSMNSLRIEGQKSISVEILQQLRWKCPDWIVIPGGNLGNVSALGMGFEMMLELGLIDRLPRIALAQSENANPLYQSFLKGFSDFQAVSAKPTLASAIQIGNPVSVKKAVRILKKFGGVVEQASEAELSDAAAEGDLYGLYNDPHTGVALGAMLKLLKKGTIEKGSKVTVISTANGLKFTEFKVKYHEAGISGTNPDLKNTVHKLEAKTGAVMDLLKKII
ncbi:MAG TPA: threonine synthase [Leptospiraceae bacterium]|nr:threonine synthase [Leptospiraceae bacterium]HNI95732.1 threonine synthase [Leptospiraceae bacterium]HNM05333.1 threonine synthase [Leptospiraceae bacterium]HNN02936.1 threonine synthase [Leptospiraceae bacterium]